MSGKLPDYCIFIIQHIPCAQILLEVYIWLSVCLWLLLPCLFLCGSLWQCGHGLCFPISLYPCHVHKMLPLWWWLAGVYHFFILSLPHTDGIILPSNTSTWVMLSTPSLSPTATSDPRTPRPFQHTNLIMGVIGGFLGAVAILFLLTMFLHVCRTKKRTRRSTVNAETMTDHEMNYYIQFPASSHVRDPHITCIKIDSYQYQNDNVWGEQALEKPIIVNWWAITAIAVDNTH